jgi:SAM-dependent methyltransferase
MPRVVPFVVVAFGLIACGTPKAPPPAPAPPAMEPHGHGHHGQGFHHRFDGAEGWAKVFDAPDRDEWQKPDAVIAELGLSPTSLVADVGAGTGYFSVRIARVVTRGKVFAIDVEADMVRYLGERAKRENLPGIVPVKAESNDPKIPEPVDVILVVDTLHHIDQREAYFGKLRSKLLPKGRIVIVDFAKNATMGPPPAHRLTPEDVVSAAQKAGLIKVKEVTLPQQYVLVLTPAS